MASNTSARLAAYLERTGLTMAQFQHECIDWCLKEGLTQLSAGTQTAMFTKNGIDWRQGAETMDKLIALYLDEEDVVLGSDRQTSSSVNKTVN